MLKRSQKRGRSLKSRFVVGPRRRTAQGIGSIGPLRSKYLRKTIHLRRCRTSGTRCQLLRLLLMQLELVEWARLRQGGSFLLRSV